MDLRVLRYFLAVAQEKNITHAAKQLLISQPALSKQLADLEQELGTPLFVRGHRQITLTESGEYLRARAMELVDLADKTVANIATEQVIGGELSIGAGESVGMQRIMNITSDIMLDYPDVKIRLVSGNAEEIEAQLTKGILDFGVIMGERPLEQYNHLQLPEYDRWGIVMRKDDPLSRLEQIQPEDLKNRPLLVSEQAIQDHRFQSWWGNTGSAIPIVGTYTLIFNAKLLVKNNRIYLLTFEHLIEDSTSEALVFRPLKPEVTEPITVIWKKNTVQSKVAELFINRLKTNLKSLA